MLRKTRNKRIAEDVATKPRGRALLHRHTAHRKTQAQDVEQLQVAEATLGETGSAFFATAGIQPDGSLREIGGQGRTWASEEDFHRERGWRAGTVVRYYPANFDKEPSCGAV